jgi:tRNA-intron endonuclease
VTAQGRLDPDGVHVADEASADRLRERGAYGERDGDALRLDLHEAAYLVEADRLVVEDAEGDPVPGAELLALGARQRERFETEHLVYRDHRARGYVIRREEAELAAWSRGAQPPRQNASRTVLARTERATTTPGDLLGHVARAHGRSRGLLVGVVDEESDVTYYETDLAHVTGEVDDPAPEAAPAGRARLLRDRALLVEAPAALVEAGYGHEVGDQRFASLAEAWHLAREGASLEDAGGEPLDADDVAARVEAARGDTHALGAYAWLRDRGLVPKTGFKFGVHYRVYDRPIGEAHAPYLVDARGPDDELTFRDVSRFVRLAHGVNKDPILWSPDGALMTRWTRP